MLNLVTTRNSIDTLFIDSDRSDDHKDLFNFIQTDFRGYDLFCDFKSLTDYLEAAEENPLLELMMDKFNKIYFDENINSTAVKEEFYNSIGEQNIFLMDLDEDTCQNLINESGYIWITVSNIPKFWENIREIRNSKKFKVTTDNLIPEPMRFNCWSKALNNGIPLTSAIIFDRYILKEESDKRFTDNLFKILDFLCNNKNLKKQIDLTIISDFKTDKDLIDAYSKIETHLRTKNYLNINLNIIKHKKAKYPSNFEGLHYRLILTNFFKIRCDDSFNFFKRNGNIHNDADLYVSFNLTSSNKPFYDKEIRDIKRYISCLKNHPPEVNLNEKIFYYKDKSNCLLN